ncbi:MAG: hypothetical protein ACOY3J_00915 [Bacillota bacterium]|uniref:Uncharacterized protein n=1 Tax=Thermanaerosceptrum fracticalcis TaxID=1712410 RepID=A0A7G6E202_THEFR|nr:hypothetical protein [Thermanaerosceptrum fracticalcis]QNB46106.1 hypothetical protein BR63_07135 [Thermanaerosceptrum fracticalcis]
MDFYLGTIAQKIEKEFSTSFQNLRIEQTKEKLRFAASYGIRPLAALGTSCVVEIRPPSTFHLWNVEGGV